MRIHPAQAKKAEKIGVTLEEHHQLIRAFWPMRNLAIFGVDARWVLEQMSAAQKLIAMAEGDGHDIKITPTSAHPVMVNIELDGRQVNGENTPIVWRNDLNWYGGEPTAVIKVAENPHKEPEFQEDPPHSLNGIPTNGAQAYAKGHMAADCPFIEGTPEFDLWNEQFDDAADQVRHDGPDDEAKFQPHSVVKHRFRAKYAEAGHPSTCGDEFATKIDQIVKNGSRTNMGLFVEICTMNGVNLDKYSRTTKGWEGRLRMTGRNMLARVVYKNEGKLKLPEMLGSELQMSQEWMSVQRFK